MNYWQNITLERWLDCRDKIQHDWFKNRYLVFLQARWKMLDKALASGAVFPPEMIATILEWESKREPMRNMIERTIDALRPSHLLDIYPLTELPSKVREELGTLADEEYQQKTKLLVRQEKLLKLFDEVDHCYCIIVKRASATGTADECSFERFFKNCVEFDAAIASLPRDLPLVWIGEYDIEED